MSKKKSKICINAGNDDLVIASKKAKRRPKVITFRNLVLKYYGSNDYKLKDITKDIVIGKLKILPTDGSILVDVLDSVNSLSMLFDVFEEQDRMAKSEHKFLLEPSDEEDNFLVHMVFKHNPKELIFDSNGQRIFPNDILSNLFIKRIREMIEFYKSLIIR